MRIFYIWCSSACMYFKMHWHNKKKERFFPSSSSRFKHKLKPEGTKSLGNNRSNKNYKFYVPFHLCIDPTKIKIQWLNHLIPFLNLQQDFLILKYTKLLLLKWLIHNMSFHLQFRW